MSNLKTAKTFLDLSDEEIRSILGQASPGEIVNVTVVLRTIKQKIGFGPNDGLTHGENCWSWGPAHYVCAFNKIAELSKTLPWDNVKFQP